MNNELKVLDRMHKRGTFININKNCCFDSAENARPKLYYIPRVFFNTEEMKNIREKNFNFNIEDIS